MRTRLAGVVIVVLALGPRTAAEEIGPWPAPSPGEPVSREIGQRSVHVYELRLEAGSYVRAVVDQQSVDIALAVFGPAGEEIARVDGPAGRRVGEQISWLTMSPGGHRLEIRTAPGETGSGVYTLDIEESRPAVAGDPRRVEAETLFAEAVHRSALGIEAERRLAIQLFERSLPLWSETGDLAAQARTLTHMGVIHRRLGETSRAIELYGEALTLVRRLPDAESSKNLANLYSNLGLAYSKVGDPARALEHYEQALAIWRRLDAPRELAATLRNAGSALRAQGALMQALPIFEDALELSRRAGDRLGEARSVNILGNCQLDLGEISAAAASFETTLEVARQLDHRELQAGALSNLGTALRRQGDLRAALSHYLEALELFRRTGRVQKVAEVLRNLGTTHLALGQMERALHHYREALTIFDQTGDPRRAAVVRLSANWVRISLGRTDEALADLQHLLDERRAAGDRETEAAVLRVVGFAELEAGRPQAARAALEPALAWWRGTGDRVHLPSVLSALGEAFYELGDPASAEARFLEAAERGHAVGSFHSEAWSLYGLARLERDRGRSGEALAHVERALEILERQRHRVPEPEQRATFFAQKRRLFELHLDLLIRLHDLRPSGGFDVAAFEASERARARALLDLLAEREESPESGSVEPESDPGLEAIFEARERALGQRFAEIEQELEELTTEDPDHADRRRALEAQRAETEQTRRQLELEIRLRLPRYHALRFGEPVKLAAVQALLDGDTALVEYALGSEGSLLFVVTREEVRTFRLPATAAQIAADVTALRSAIATPGRRRLASYRSVARSLYERLLAPAEELLADKTRLFVVPDGGLHVLPFEVLLTVPPDASAGLAELPYLLARWSVVSVPSAGVLVFLEHADGELREAPPSPEGPTLLAFADPVTGRRSRLAGSEGEASAIAALHLDGEAVVRAGEEATETRVKSDPQVATARRLHFATHGLLDERHPQHSGLVLTAGEGEDGVLKVYEIFRLRLAAELVVLSACETGLGEEIRGEGLIGLTRAFLYAGAPRVLVSLWKVDDRATAELMVRFYRGLEEPAAGTAAETLRAVKLALLQEERFAHPAHWAAFVLIGLP